MPSARALRRAMGLGQYRGFQMPRRCLFPSMQASYMSTLPLELLKTSSSPADGECAAGTISQLTPKIAKWEYAIEGSPLWPSNLIERVIEAVHLYSDLSWGGTIVVYTILMRALLLPALVKQTRSTILANNLRPMVQQMQSEVQLLRNQGRKEESYRKLQDMSKFMSERGINPAGILGLSILPLPFFMSTFFALRNMAKQPVASLLDGGPFWFENLTIPDPYYILPIVSTISLISTLEVPYRCVSMSISFFRYQESSLQRQTSVTAWLLV